VLSFPGGITFEVFVQPVALTTAPLGLTAQVAPVYSVYDAPAARDKIALVVLPYSRHAALFQPDIAALIAATVKEGPRAVVLVTTGPTGRIIALNTREHAVAAVPLALMAPADLPGVLEAIHKDNQGTLTITGTSGMRPTWNIIATRKRGVKWLVISTPRTGWFTCVGERGTGTAVFLELCAWAARSYPDLSILALNTGGHEIDFSGSHRALHLAPPPERTAMWAHIGASVAVRDSHILVDREIGLLDVADTNRALMLSEGLMSSGARCFAGLPGLEEPIRVIPGVGELGDIVAGGYRKAFTVVGAHRWFHTREDTLDKVDARLLTPVLAAHRQLIADVLS